VKARSESIILLTVIIAVLKAVDVQTGKTHLQNGTSGQVIRMTELERAVQWLKYLKMVKECEARNYPHRAQDVGAVHHCRVLLDALRKQKDPMDVIEDQWATCPSCGYEELERIAHVDSADFETRKIVISETWMPKHCPECGQKLRWSESAPPKEG
jgi:hypothetical protein